jgi:hypothetical protein
MRPGSERWVKLSQNTTFTQSLCHPRTCLVPIINVCNVIQKRNGATDWPKERAYQAQRGIATVSTLLGGVEL